MRVSLSPEEFKELLLSHHPNLPCFKDDVVILFNRRICAGCLFAYPAALMTLVVFGPTGTDSILIALLLAVLSQARRFVENSAIQNFFRFIAGIGLGFGIGGGYWAIVNDQWVVFTLLTFGVAGYLILKVLSMKCKLENYIFHKCYQNV